MFSQIEGLDALLLKLSKLSQLKHITGGLKLIAAHIQGILQVYPTRRHFTTKFKTARQRRYFFWALKQNKIAVPYVRGSSPGSRNLKQQWRIRTETPVRVALENNTRYAAYVQGATLQASFHKATGWKTDDAAVEEARPMAVTIMRQRVQRVLAGLTEE